MVITCHLKSLYVIYGWVCPCWCRQANVTDHRPPVDCLSAVLSPATISWWKQLMTRRPCVEGLPKNRYEEGSKGGTSCVTGALKSCESMWSIFRACDLHASHVLLQHGTAVYVTESILSDCPVKVKDTARSLNIQLAHTDHQALFSV